MDDPEHCDEYPAFQLSDSHDLNFALASKSSWLAGNSDQFVWLQVPCCFWSFQRPRTCLGHPKPSARTISKQSALAMTIRVQRLACVLLSLICGTATKQPWQKGGFGHKRCAWSSMQLRFPSTSHCQRSTHDALHCCRGASATPTYLG